MEMIKEQQTDRGEESGEGPQVDVSSDKEVNEIKIKKK